MNKQERNAKKLLDRFYRAILVWVLNPEKNEYGFDVSAGMCDNLTMYLYMAGPQITGGYDTRTLVRDIQEELFREAYGTSLHPFNSSLDNYCMESFAGKIYTNKDRLAFIVNQVVSKDLQEEIYRVATVHAMREKDGRMAAGLCCGVGPSTEMKRWLVAAYGCSLFPFEQAARNQYWADQIGLRLYSNPTRLHFIDVMTSAVREA